MQALDDAVIYRDARSHVVQSAVRRQDRRMQRPAGRETEVGAEHRKLARDYERLKFKLKAGG